MFLLLAFLAWARIKALEGLRYCAPGEWGKVLGLDRIPEVRTLRNKLRPLGREEPVAQWAAALSRDWMTEDPERAGTLHVDGQVRVYHGEQTRLPRHYLSRQRLCLRATTDYWVNAADGQPFFVVHRPVDPGLLKVLEEQIVPRLEREVPGQPTAEPRAADPALDKLTIVPDREGFSPEVMARLTKRRIAILTCHKYPGPDWPEAEFQVHKVKLIHGQEEELKLAERRVKLSNGLVVWEMRHLDQSGHQTAILTTSERLSLTPVAVARFARWSQENFLRCMRQHSALDDLVNYAVVPRPETTQVVNPAWRKLDREIRSLQGQLTPKLARLGAMNRSAPIEPELVEAFLKKQGALPHEITALQEKLTPLKDQRKTADQHVPLGPLPKEEQFARLSSVSKDWVDTIKLIAYRAETAMAAVVREALPKGRPGEARRLLPSLYASEADLIPDEAAGTLTVRWPYPANAVLGQAVEQFCTELTATETIFPTTKLRLVYELVATQNPRDQES